MKLNRNNCENRKNRQITRGSDPEISEAGSRVFRGRHKHLTGYRCDHFYSL